MNDPDSTEFERAGLPAGRGGGGDSGGGAYPNPHTGKKPGKDGMMGKGGQTDMAYRGGDNHNAPAEGGSSDKTADR